MLRDPAENIAHFIKVLFMLRRCYEEFGMPERRHDPWVARKISSATIILICLIPRDAPRMNARRKYLHGIIKCFCKLGVIWCKHAKGKNAVRARYIDRVVYRYLPVVPIEHFVKHTALFIPQIIEDSFFDFRRRLLVAALMICFAQYIGHFRCSKKRAIDRC